MKPARLLLSVLVLLHLVACNPRTQQKALATSLSALNSGMIVLDAWDETAQRNIVSNAASYEDGQRALATHRENRKSLLRGATLAYGALAVAATAVEAKSSDAPLKLLEAVKAVEEFYRILKFYTGDDQ